MCLHLRRGFNRIPRDPSTLRSEEQTSTRLTPNNNETTVQKAVDVAMTRWRSLRHRGETLVFPRSHVLGPFGPVSKLDHWAHKLGLAWVLIWCYYKIGFEIWIVICIWAGEGCK
ncbi:hypothetical protein ES288_A03G179500v1 [Gossypium darwinii]|uniref:Uncharacterized protein n=1 Tax=Gossypium darwinii TaxID=34276 RepID=A0A5D2H7R1_GOSDA|nr:hypothetical protein ES288_A03G179500v1 [Gossypium darwinii]